MKVRLYTTVKVREARFDGPRNVQGATKVIYDSVANKTIALMPLSLAEQTEELLGEFDAAEVVRPNGSKVIRVSGKRTVDVAADSLTKETEVNTFRVELL